MKSIEEQKLWLKSQFEVELLTSNNANKAQIADFEASKQGKGLENFLKNFAWKEDISGSTKVYLVKDKTNGAIVFFFALKAGLLYQSIESDDYNLSEKEREIVKLCIELLLDTSSTTTPDEVFSWYEGEEIDADRLLRIIDEKYNIKLRAKQDKDEIHENVNILRVSKTFPGIVLTHFCKNQNYVLKKELSFPLGFYIFWEIIIDTVLTISQKIGCQYLYLFAADNTERFEDTAFSMNASDFPDEIEEPKTTYKLIDYYKNELKFEDIQTLTVLKPSYDFSCYSLIQPISELSIRREIAWIQHSDIADEQIF